MVSQSEHYKGAFRMPIIPEDKGVIEPPNTLPSETAGTPSTPNSLTPETPVDPAIPNDLTAIAAVLPVTPNDLSSRCGNTFIPFTDIGDNWTDDGGGAYSRVTDAASSSISYTATDYNEGDIVAFTFTVSNLSGLGFRASVQGGALVLMSSDTNGVHTLVCIAGASGTTRILNQNVTTEGTVSDISVSCDFIPIPNVIPSEPVVDPSIPNVLTSLPANNPSPPN